MGIIKNFLNTYQAGKKSQSDDKLAELIARKMADLPHGYWPIKPQTSAASIFNSNLDYLSAAQKLSWVNVCCGKIATQMAMTKYGVADVNDNEVKNKDLAKLLTAPNPFATFYDLIELSQWQVLLGGNAYLWKVKASLYDNSPRGKYSELWLICPAMVEVVKSETEYITGYKIRYEHGKEVTIPKEQILHLKEPNPIDDRVGMGKIQANEMLYNTEYAAQFFNWNFFAKGGLPSADLEIPADINDEQIKEIKARLKEFQSVENSHKILPLIGGMKLNRSSANHKDMEFIEQRKFNREEILGIFGVPPAVAGIFEYANYANTKEQTNMFLSDTIQPRLIKLASALTRGIVRDFEPSAYFWFENVVRKDEQMYMQIARDGVGSGLLTPNEARTQYLDQPEAEGNPAMDEYYLPINMIPISESSFETTTDNTTVSKSAPEKKKINAAVVKQIYRASVNTRRKIGKSIKKDMKSFFTAQEGRVMAALDSEKSLVFDRKLSVGDIFDADAERKLLQKELKKGHIGVILRAIQDTNGALGTEVDPSTSNPQVTARVGKMANRSRLITNTTMEKIQNTIKDGLDAGDSIGDLKKRVESVFDIARGYRAEMIARTESAKAYDMGSILSYDEAGIEFVDVIGCEDNETDCNSRHVPIGEADQLEFHPNHTGVIVPSA